MKRKLLTLLCGFSLAATSFAAYTHALQWCLTGNKNTNPKTGAVQYRAGKGSIYEGAFRVPFLACWPGKIVSINRSELAGAFRQAARAYREPRYEAVVQGFPRQRTRVVPVARSRCRVLVGKTMPNPTDSPSRQRARAGLRFQYSQS